MHVGIMSKDICYLKQLIKKNTLHMTGNCSFSPTRETAQKGLPGRWTAHEWGKRSPLEWSSQRPKPKDAEISQKESSIYLTMNSQQMQVATFCDHINGKCCAAHLQRSSCLDAF